MNGTGNLQNTMFVENIMNKDVICSGVVGLVGVPFSIETTSDFETATLSFKIDQSKLGDTDFNNLLFLWYDEENHNFVELDTIYDETNSTVSIETTHFSRYMVVDKLSWFEAWSKELNYTSITYEKSAVYSVLAVDCSGSMSSCDPITIIPPNSAPYKPVYSCERQKAVSGFTNALDSDDKAAIVTFESSASTVCGLTDNQSELYWGSAAFYNGGGTEFDAALRKSIDILQASSGGTRKRIILLSDGYSSVSDSILTELKKNYIKVYTVGIGNCSDSVLRTIATETGGEYIKAYNASELISIYSNLGFNDDFDTTDTDGDKLYDTVESAGIRLENGIIIYTDPTTKYTDPDCLEDGEEIDPTPLKSNKTVYNDDGTVKTVKGYYFIMKSDPRTVDTDGDTISDDKDPLPNTYGISNRLRDLDKAKLLSEIDTQINNDVDWKRLLVQYPYNSVSDCIDILYQYDELITDLSNTYFLPKAAIQSVLLRELKCYWGQDDVADSMVISYYTYQHCLEDYYDMALWQQLLIGPPEYPLLSKEDSSTGYGQIFASTAINANNWAVDEGIISRDKYDYDDWHQREEIWDELRTNNEYNISMVALVLMHGASRKGFDRVYYDYSVAKIKKMLAVYNGDDSYGEVVYNSYVIFDKYNY
mgnify:CR=1 FL=1